MELNTYGQDNDHIPDMIISCQKLAERKLTSNNRYRSMIGQLEIMIELVRLQPGCDLTTRLDRLLDVMLGQIGSENDFMALVGYPQIKKHRLHHQFICSNSTELRYRFSKGLDVLSDELDNVRLLWLIHIKMHDRAFEEFMAS